MPRLEVCSEHKYHFLNAGQGNLHANAIQDDIVACVARAEAKGYTDVEVCFRTDANTLYLTFRGLVLDDRDMELYVKTVMWKDDATTEEKTFAKEYLRLLLTPLHERSGGPTTL